jgi:hypothetical protein
MPNRAAPPSYGAPPAYAPPGESAPVRRDLAGNVIAGAAPAAPPPANPYAYASGPQVTPQPGTWPPPPSGTGASPSGMPQTVNDSGQKEGVPPEIAAFKWNWGAFGMTWLWCLNHGMIAWGIGILLLGIVLRAIPGIGAVSWIVSVAVSIYFGIMGHKLGWRNRHFAGGVPQFIDVERAWMRWAVGVLTFFFLVGILGAILFPVFARARMQARLRANGGYTQPYNLPTNTGNGGQ